MTLAEPIARSAKRATRDELAARLEAAERELAEARAERLATGEILEAIGGLAAKPDRTEGDLQAVLDSLVGAAVKLCGAANGILYLARGETYAALAIYAEQADAEAFAWLKAAPAPPDRRTIVGRVLSTGQAQNVASAYADPEYAAPLKSVLASDQAFLGVPLRRGGATVGAIVLARTRLGLFSARQAEVAQSFADQAVIAIENARLFEQVQAKSSDLEESLAQQTATADVLKVIGRSAFDLEAVLNTLIGSAQTLCDADFGTICLREGDYFHAYAAAGVDPAFLAALKAKPQHIDGLSLTPRVGRTGRVQHIPDRLLDPEYEAPDGTPTVAHPRTLLGVPLLREGKVEGSFVLMRTAHRPFARKDIELAETFADQAMIAIGNVRLFDEVRARTRDLEESLAQQTATGDVLKVIASSPSDVQPVFDAIAASANRLLGGLSGAVLRMIGDSFHLAAFTPVSPAADQALKQAFPRPITEFPTLEGLRRGETVEFPDTEAEGVPAVNRDLARARGYRAMLHVPLLSGGAPIGLISVTRAAPGPFAINHIELLRAFADQAVIAIRNVDLFNETKEALKQQTATADVLKVISRSAFDLQKVLDTLVRSARDLCNADSVALMMYEGKALRFEAGAGMPQQMADFNRGKPEDAAPDPLSQYVVESRHLVHVADCWEDPRFRHARPVIVGGIRAALGVPMLRDGEVLGFFGLTRFEPKAFSEREIALAQTFVDQAQIAIENARLFQEVQAKTRDLEESLAQQTATADVLKVISRSAFDLQTVLDTLVQSAVKLCEAGGGMMYLRSAHGMVVKAQWNPVSEGVLRVLARRPQKAGRDSIGGRILLTGEIEEVFDVYLDPDYDPELKAAITNRALLGVPLKRDGETIGAFVLARPKPGHFSPRQIELVQTFADQAVIAIENARLLDEVRARTRDLEESLAQQTATADVLKVISRSVFDLDTVLQSLIDTAVRLTRGSRGTIFIKQGEALVARAFHSNVPGELRKYLSETAWRLDGDSHMARAVRDHTVVHVPDLSRSEVESDKQVKKRASFGAGLWIPLMRGEAPIGVFGVPRDEPIAFSEREIELVQTFADQAVIAIENSRLFEQVRAKTRDLEDALAKQTATAEILRVISRSPTDANPVFESIVAAAARLLPCDLAFIMLVDGKSWWNAAAATSAGMSKLTLLDKYPVDPSLNFPSRAIVAKTTIDLPDWSEIELPEHQIRVRALNGINSSVHVPFLRDGECVGLLTLLSRRARAFGSSEIAQAESFRDQALIAIENSRLFNETQEALKLQTATADVLKVIGRSAFDLQAVLDTLLSSAVELNGAYTGAICVREGDVYPYRAFTTRPDLGEALADYVKALPAAPGRGTIAGRAILSGEVEQIPDIAADSEYAIPMAERGNPSRALIAVPLLGKERIEGAFVLTRLEPGLYPQRQIEILQTFADQAVIAIENARLLDEVQARTRELERSLSDLRKAQDRLVQSEKLASLGQLTAGIAHEIKNPLNFVNNFASLSRELLDEMKETLAPTALDSDARADVDEVMGMLDANLEKIAHHGKRADSIVKNMLLHSREGSGERTRVSVNAMVEEALNLGYHGARAEKPGFNVTIEKSLDPQAGDANLYLQEITRVLLNLISNGFYAMAKRKEAEGVDYQPTLTASTRALGANVEIRVRDNGPGIAEDVRAKMFNPFFTTKPAGEGTGLGLSLTHDIVVKQHGGTIDVETEPGAFTEFVLTLPRREAKA